MLQNGKQKIVALLMASAVGSLMSVPTEALSVSNGDYKCEAIKYAVFSESATDVPILNIKSRSISDEVHTNYAASADDVSYMSNFSASFMSFDHDTYTEEHNSTLQGSELDLNVFGIQGLGVECKRLNIDEILGANESVDVVCCDLNGVENSDTVIFSSNGNITITADNIDFNGVIYAPNGKIILSADNININGSVIGDCVEINSDSCTIQCNEKLIDDFGIATYDISELSSFEKVSGDSSGNGMLRSGSSTAYYYNTGTDVVAQATYSKYRLLSVVKKGDIIHETVKDGNIFGRITDHIAYVEGIYYLPLYGSGSSSSTYKYNIRTIEALGSYGVCRSILDDNRCETNEATLLRYKTDLSSTKIATITHFISMQIGKPYDLPIINWRKNTSINSSEWYCSELVWAGYNYCGYDIEDGDFGLVTPGDILDSSNTRTISYK